jgi:fatty acid desaturase
MPESGFGDRSPGATAFSRELDALLAETRAGLGQDDLDHLTRIEWWGRACTAAGYATAWILPNPASMLLLSQGRLTRWAMVAHHVVHRGYDKVPNVAAERTSERFARGFRRFLDWLDWIDPEAWAHEHNQLHHYRLNEAKDPDLVERNLDWLRSSHLPMPLRYALVTLVAATWKFSYYAPNTLRKLMDERARRNNPGVPQSPIPLAAMFTKPALWARCLLPYAGIQFGLLPLLFAPLGVVAYLSVLINSLGAELLTNLHAFLVITTNHAGADLEACDTPITQGKSEFYYRQAAGSANFTGGSDLVDFLHGFLNYQIEHHLFPDLPMLAYQRMQPRVKAICAKHGVPYVQESVWTRLRKTLDIMVGRTSMKRPVAVAGA